MIHELFYRFAKILPNIKEVEEHGLHKENRTSLSQLTSEGKPDISRIPSSSLTLPFLFRACQRWYTDFPEWAGLESEPGSCYDTVLLLLDWLQGDFHPIWHLLGSDAVRLAKPLITSKLRSFLSNTNSSLLLQVRFIT